MRKIFFITILIILIYGVAPTVFAIDGYVPIEPLPGITKGSKVDLSNYIDKIIKIGIVLAALLAVVKIVIAGLLYISAGGSPGNREKANGMIWDAIIGLLIVVGFWLILTTINPNLLNINDVIKTIGDVREAPIPPETPPGPDHKNYIYGIMIPDACEKQKGTEASPCKTYCTANPGLCTSGVICCKVPKS